MHWDMTMELLIEEPKVLTTAKMNFSYRIAGDDELSLEPEIVRECKWYNTCNTSSCPWNQFVWTRVNNEGLIQSIQHIQGFHSLMNKKVKITYSLRLKLFPKMKQVWCIKATNKFGISLQTFLKPIKSEFKCLMNSEADNL